MPTSSLWIIYGTDFIVRFWFFASQSAIILALSYAADVREREQQIIPFKPSHRVRNCARLEPS